MDDKRNALKSAPFEPADLARGEDGELYHLPTLRALHAAGRLLRGSAGHTLLTGRGGASTARLIA